MEKGVQPLQAGMILLVMTLIFMGLAVNPLQASIDETVRQNILVRSHEIVSVINLLKSSPYKTLYTINLDFQSSVTECTMIVRRNGIDIRYENNGKEDRFFLGVIEGGPELQDTEIDCREESITVEREESGVTIS